MGSYSKTSIHFVKLIQNFFLYTFIHLDLVICPKVPTQHNKLYTKKTARGLQWLTRPTKVQCDQPKDDKQKHHSLCHPAVCTRLWGILAALDLFWLFPVSCLFAVDVFGHHSRSDVNYVIRKLQQQYLPHFKMKQI